MITAENITKRFGGLTAVDDLSLELETGEITGLIGPNGAGKTVFFNTITGFYPPDSGNLYYRDEEITDLPVWERTNLGIARGFQLLRIYEQHTVRKNLVLAGLPNSFWQNFRSSMLARPNEAVQDRADEILAEFGLAEKADTTASELSFGQAKILQFGMLLMKEPSLILLDEVMAGVNTEDSRRMIEYIQEYNDEGITFFIVEHDVASIMDVCNYVYVMDQGRLIADGRPGEIREHEEVVDVYLGEEDA